MTAGSGGTVPGPLCRACGREVPPGVARCPHCSAPLALLDVCPCCGAQAGASPHPELRFACDVCGGPRIPGIDPSLRFGGGETALLRRADGARKARAGWRAAAIGAGVLLPLALLFSTALLLVFGASAAVILIALATVGPLGALFAFGLGRAAARGREIAPALDGAWLAAAADVARSTRGLTAATLAQKLGVSEAEAEQLVALLDADAVAGPRVRVHVEEPAADVAMSEEEAALAERIDEAARARSEAGPGGRGP